jgi:hypothetical protein
MSDESEQGVLFPGREVAAKGETITVLPLFFGQYPPAMKLMRPLATSLSAAKIFKFQPGVDEQGAPTSKFVAADDWLSKLPQIFEEGGEALILFLAFAIGKPRKWFDTLPGDEGFALARAVFEENADFFVRRILPMLQAAGLAGPAAKDGDPSSPDSGPSDTPGPTSSE